LEILPYNFENFDKITELLDSVYNDHLTKEFWEWRFHKINDKPVGFMMWEDDKIIGQYMTHPISLQISNKIEKVLFSMATITHPLYRGRNIFKKLADYTYQNLEMKYKLVYGFPNENSAPVFFNKLGWCNLGNMTIFEKEINDQMSFFEKPRMEIKRLFESDKIIDDIWEENKEFEGHIVPRTREYVNWRFFSIPKFKMVNRPISSYYIFLVLINNHPSCYFVLKKYAEKIHLIDYFGNISSTVLESILNFSMKFCIDNKIKTFSFWHTEYLKNCIPKENLRKYGFNENQTKEFFGIKMLSDDVQIEISDKKSWFLNMSDSDVF
jgi:hypothetical protein